MSVVVYEQVAAITSDGKARVIRRWHRGQRSYRRSPRDRYNGDFRDYVIERLVDGAWVRSANGPYDYFQSCYYELCYNPLRPEITLYLIRYPR